MSKAFEPATLPLAEKERLARSLLDEFALSVHHVRGAELIIPCTLGPHQDQDRNPTAALNFDKLTYKCLGCQASGGLLWFIAEHRNSTAKQARDWLAKETGTDGQVMDLLALLRYFDALYDGKRAKPPLPTYSERTLEPWLLIHPYLTDPPDYDEQGCNVGGRGIPLETLERFKVGYAEAYPMGTKDNPRPPSERIVLPHFWQGRLVGWQTRRLADDGTPKYKSSPEFPKDSTVYNYDPQAECAVVVEAMLSVLRHEHHVHMEATFGADITTAQIRLLARHPKVVFWLDNDNAGWRSYAGLRDQRGRQTKPGVLERLAEYTNVWVVENPYPADPADLDDATVDELVAHAVPYSIWEPPTYWRCPRCRDHAHEGGCAA